VAPPDEKRIKFCRYCDGVIEWGTEVCPHCGETLKVTKFDDLDFATGPSAAPPASGPSGPVLPAGSGDDLETVDFEALDVPTTQEMPVLRPVGESPPVIKPVKGTGRPPVMKPIASGPAAPVLKPIEEGTPPEAPATSVTDCPLCGEKMVLRGGACKNCGKVVCIPCLMRANGMRTGRVMEMNRVRWSDRSRKLGPDGIICPQCGNKGVNLS